MSDNEKRAALASRYAAAVHARQSATAYAEATPKNFESPAPDPNVHEDGPQKGQHKNYWVLSEAERAKGFLRPVRRSYIHAKCGAKTTMSLALAETYARDPKFYGATFCCGCGSHFRVGAEGEFVWDDGTSQKVGT